MDGYYEFTGQPGAKIPHFLHADGTLAAAGLAWHIGNGPDRQRCFVVITREARDASGEVHNRMPAFLTADMRGSWLYPESLTVPGDTATSHADREKLACDRMAASDLAAATIRAHVVDRRVNNSRTADPTDPALIQPLPA